MKIKNIIKFLVSKNYNQLAKTIYKLVINDLAEFNEENIYNLIEIQAKLYKDNSLILLIHELRKNGILIKINKRGQLI